MVFNLYIDDEIVEHREPIDSLTEYDGDHLKALPLYLEDYYGGGWQPTEDVAGAFYLCRANDGRVASLYLINE